MDKTSPLMKQRRRILVVEDNDLVACMVADLISISGHSALGPVDSEDAAISALDDRANQIDLVVLDVHFPGSSSNVARKLVEKGIPFVWATGCGDDIPETYSETPVCLKPFTRRQLLHSLNEAFVAAA